MVQPYLFFGGRCEEAIEFYKKTLGAKVEMIMRYNESPEPQPPGMLPKGFEKKIMHSSLVIGKSKIMASDGCSEGANFDGFSLSVYFSSTDEVQKAFKALSEGGKVTMALAKTFWSPMFGMLKDKFGVGWMLTVEH